LFICAIDLLIEAIHAPASGKCPGNDRTQAVAGSEEVVGEVLVVGLTVIRVPNMTCLTSYALALVLVACVKVRKAK
jgi:hypothetical protein